MLVAVAFDSEGIVQKIGVLIADDHAIFRSGLRLLIDAQLDMAVLGDVADYSSAVSRAVESSPNVVLMDYSMPGGNTCHAIEAIRRRLTGSRVLVLSMHDDPAYLVAVMTAGASGYVLKRSADTELLFAIRAVNRGESYFDPHLVRAVVERSLRGRVIDSTRQLPKSGRLTAREQQVLELVASGHTNQQIANRLVLSIKTVESYRARLMRKLRLTSRAELFRYARETGLFARDSARDVIA